MDELPAEALAALDAAAGIVDRMVADGVEIHFAARRFGRRCQLRATLRDEQGSPLQELTLLEALQRLSA